MWLNDGKGNFRDSGQVFDEGDTHVHGMALGDVDGDGRPDIVLAMTTPGRAGKIYLNDGKGRFHDSGQIIGHQWAHSVALGDLNGDGHLDIFLACGEPRTGTPNEVWLNDGKGHFRDSGLRLGDAFSWDVALGDLNGDGRLDAFVANLRLADDSKNPPVFGGVPAEVWLNTTASTTTWGRPLPARLPWSSPRALFRTDTFTAAWRFRPMAARCAGRAFPRLPVRVPPRSYALPARMDVGRNRRRLLLRRRE